MNFPLEASRSAATEALATFVAQSLTNYSKSRNFDFGPSRRANVSQLSPYVRHRLILEQELLEAALYRCSLATVEKFVEEVFWRSYFKGWLEHRPEVWKDYRESLTGLIRTLENDHSLRARYNDAVSGQTGIECFDSWVTEIRQTGYLHNHARMWFASIWIFTLGLPWQLGADFFYRHLLDGDPASNTLSWRWVGGLHTRGKIYLANSSNISRYSDNRFNPTGQLATDARPLEEARVFPAGTLPIPASRAPQRPYGLLITEEDCCPETMALADAPNAVLGLVATNRRSPLPVAEAPRDFAAGAVMDAVRRATQNFAVDGEFGNNDSWADLLVDWASRHGLKTVVTSYAPVGPVQELLDAHREKLESQDIKLLQLRRPYDSLTWPHARRGYFKLRAKIPYLLERLELRESTLERHNQAV